MTLIDEMITHCALVETLIERIEARGGSISDRSQKAVRGRELRMIYNAASNAIRAGMKFRAKVEREALEPSLWLAVGRDNRVKYTLDKCRAEHWKRSGKYANVHAYVRSGS